MSNSKRRLVFGLISLVLLGVEILIGLFAHGWIRNYIGDLLVVILIYTIIRTIYPNRMKRWYIIPTAVILFAFGVEFLQLWGFCDRFGITNRFLRIIIGTGFSFVDLLSYAIGIVSCYISEYISGRA